MARAISRRTVLSAAASAGAISLAGPLVRAQGKAEANDRLRLGLIGCGRRGRQMIPVFQGFRDVDLAAICDVNAQNLDKAHKLLDGKPDRVADYRKILDRKDIDAVVIATTEHWHGLPFIHAAAAGKHVYVEKPLSHTVVEGRAMVRAARKAGIIAMMGTQQRGQEHYGPAIELVRSGRLGNVALVECWNTLKFGKGWLSPVVQGEPPAWIDWDRWLGPAPQVPFDSRRLNGYPFWFAYGGGFMTNWGPHHTDIILSAMGVSSPTRATCLGSQYILRDLGDTPDTFQASWEFPDFLMQYRLQGQCKFPGRLSRPSDHGIAFYGDQGTLLLDRMGYDFYLDKDLRKPAEKSGPTQQDGPWHRTFVECVKNRRKPPIDLEHSHNATVCCHLGNIAYLTKRAICWDAKNEKILDDEKAADMLSRPRRKGYELPKV